MSEKTEYFWGTGRRKTSVARVRLRPGTGKMTVNGRDLDAFFHVEKDRRIATDPVKATKVNAKFDVIASVIGGGTTGQAGAVKLGMARALEITVGEREVHNSRYRGLRDRLIGVLEDLVPDDFKPVVVVRLGLMGGRQ